LVDYSIYDPIGSQERTKQLQWYEQPDFREQGVNPVYKHIGINSAYNAAMNIAHKETRIVGSRKQFSDRKLMEEGTVSVTYEMNTDGGTVLPRYGIEDPGGPGTIEMPVSFLEEVTFPGGNTKYRQFNDCVTETITFAFERDFIITQDFYSAEITKFMTLAELQTELGLGSASPQFAPPLTGEPWNHLDHSVDCIETGSSVTIGGDEFLIEAASVECANNLRKQNPLGYCRTRHLSAGNKAVTGTVTMYVIEAQVMIDRVRDFTPHNIEIKIKEASTPGDVIFTVTAAKFNNFSDAVEAGSNDWSLIEIPFTASDCSITAYP
jgi:Phage tail tube protein